MVDAYASLVTVCQREVPLGNGLLGCIVKISDLELLGNNELYVNSYVCTSIDGTFYVDEDASFSINANHDIFLYNNSGN